MGLVGQHGPRAPVHAPCGPVCSEVTGNSPRRHADAARIFRSPSGSCWRAIPVPAGRPRCTVHRQPTAPRRGSATRCHCVAPSRASTVVGAPESSAPSRRSPCRRACCRRWRRSAPAWPATAGAWRCQARRDAVIAALAEPLANLLPGCVAGEQRQVSGIPGNPAPGFRKSQVSGRVRVAAECAVQWHQAVTPQMSAQVS
mgnify:CR=1 FL=1